MATNFGGDASMENAARSIRVHCVCIGDSTPDDECNVFLKKAFETLLANELNPIWTKEKDCAALKTRSKAEIFIFSEFEGSGFENLRSLGCSIVGPSVVLNCIQESKSMPRTRQPLFSGCLAGMVVCCTNLSKPDRERARDRVQFMRGCFEGSLSNECSILVAKEVGSLKYKAAVRKGDVKIVTPEWVDTMWKKCHSEVFKVQDVPELFDQFKCPIFAGLVITSSKITHEERKRMEQLIKENGGTFKGEMKQGEATHLVTDNIDSDKYKTAKKWTDWPMKIVTIEWINESVRNGQCMDENDYLTDKKCGVSSSPKRKKQTQRKQKCSTPTANDASTSGAPGLSFNDPNFTAMTTMIPEAPNVTYESNATLQVSCVENSAATTTAAAAAATLNGAESTPAPSGAHRSVSDNGEATTTVAAADGSATTVAQKSCPALALVDEFETPSKRLRSMNDSQVTAPPPNKDSRSSTATAERRSSVAQLSNRDVVSQYLVSDASPAADPNRSFVTRFDVASAMSFVDKGGMAVEKNDKGQQKAPEQSPSTIVGQKLRLAVEGTAAGTSVYNSPSTPKTDIRVPLEGMLARVLGSTTVKRHVYKPAPVNDTSISTIASPVTPAAPPKATNQQTPLRPPHFIFSQDTQDQDMVVSWDDPNQKAEREKLGGLLKSHDEPTQGPVTVTPGKFPLPVFTRRRSNLTKRSDYHSDTNGMENEAEKEPDVSEVSEHESSVAPSNDEMEEEEPDAPSQAPREFIFQFTSLNKIDKDQFTETVKKLGGTLTEDPNFDPNCTHLVSGAFTRNEKLLSGIANGSWVLYVSYLRACEDAGAFVDETEHEFAHPKVSRMLTGLKDEVTRLMRTSTLWRKKIQSGDGKKPFVGWKVFLTADNAKQEGFARILKVGGAWVTTSINDAREGQITHVLVDTGKKLSSVTSATVNRLQASGADCYRCEVIFDQLAGESLSSRSFQL